MPLLWSLLWLVLGYLCGSVPFAYLAGRIMRGIDLRQYGSQAVTGSNVYEHVSRLAFFLVGLLDACKAGLPTLLALRFGFGLPVALLAGLGAIAGHNWPLFLKFQGGRGLAACGGVLTVMYPPLTLWLILVLLVGWLLKNSALSTLFFFVTLPLIAWAAGQPDPLIWACLAMFVLILVKRLEANRRPLPPPPDRWRILARRALLDRDWVDLEAWVRRMPGTRTDVGPETDSGPEGEPPE